MFKGSLLFLLVLILAAPVFSAEIRIVGPEGEPLEHAVVMAHGNSGPLLKASAASVSEEPAIMDQIDKQFVPHVLLINRGQNVVFPNSDQVRHHVYSFSEPKRFEIKLYDGVPPAPIQFERPGLVALGCNIHDSMLGYIFVSEASNAYLSDASGKVNVDTGGGDLIALRVWHPRMGPNAAPLELPYENTEEVFEIKINIAAPKPKKRFGSRFRRDEYEDL